MRKNTSRLFPVIALLLVLATALSACGKPAGTDGTSGTGAPATGVLTPGEKSSDFVYVIPSEPTTMDAHLCPGPNDGRIMRLVNETLYRRDENSEVQTLLADTASVSEDGLVWTIKLKPNIKFHDGTPLNAEAVKFTFDRLQNPTTASPKASALQSVAKTVVVDDLTVDVHLHAPNLIFLATLSNYTTAILSPTAVEKHGLDMYGQNPVGTGPLKFEKWDRGMEIKLVRNDDYWDKMATVTSLTIRWAPEDSTRVMMMQSGDADIATDIPPIQVESLEKQGVAITKIPGMRTIALGMNVAVPPLDDERVRLAINYAINKQEIIDTVLKGLPLYPSGFWTPAVQYAPTDLDAHEQDIEKAKALLVEAGYPDGFTIKLTGVEGSFAMDRQVAEVIQGMLSKIGIKAEAQILDSPAHSQALSSHSTELFIFSKGCSTGDPEYDMQLHLVSGGGQNFYNYSDSVTDKMILEDLVNAPDLDTRAKVLYDITKRFNDQSAVVPLYYQVQLYAVRSDVEGFINYPNELVDLAYLTRK